MRKWKLLASALLVSLVASLANAQTVTVAKSGPADFNTISAAIASFTPDPDTNALNMITISDSAVYEESILINVPVTLQGSSSSSRPVICGVNSATSGNDGININIPTGTSNTVVLKNLIVLPSRTSPPSDDGIGTVGQNLYLEMQNVLVTANNGSDGPVTTDGLTTPTLTSATYFGDDGIFVGGTTTPTGPGMEAYFKNVVVSATNYNGTGNDQLVCSGSGLKYTISDGCVFSFGGRLGIQCGKDFIINAPNKRCFVGYNKGFAGIWFASASANSRVVNGANVVYNNGLGMEHQNGGAAGLTLSNAIFAGNALTNLQCSEVGITAPINITSVTFAGQTTGSAILTNAAATANITLKDCIVAGNGTSNVSNSIVHNGTGTLTFNGTAAVLSGPFKLASAVSGTGPVSGAPSVTADPHFASTTDPLASSYYDVTNTAYATVSSTSGPLSGGADYAGTSAVPTWTLY